MALPSYDLLDAKLEAFREASEALTGTSPEGDLLSLAILAGEAQNAASLVFLEDHRALSGKAAEVLHLAQRTGLLLRARLGVYEDGSPEAIALNTELRRLDAVNHAQATGPFLGEVDQIAYDNGAKGFSIQTEGTALITSRHAENVRRRVATDSADVVLLDLATGNLVLNQGPTAPRLVADATGARDDAQAYTEGADGALLSDGVTQIDKSSKGFRDETGGMRDETGVLVSQAEAAADRANVGLYTDTEYLAAFADDDNRVALGVLRDGRAKAPVGLVTQDVQMDTINGEPMPVAGLWAPGLTGSVGYLDADYRLLTAPTSGVTPSQLAGELARDAEATIERVTVWERGTEGYNTFRLPAAVLLNSGRVLVVGEGRQQTGDFGPIDAVYKTSDDGGLTWSANKVVHGATGERTTAPTPLYDATLDRLICVYGTFPSDKEVADFEAETARMRYWTREYDEVTDTWGAATEISSIVPLAYWYGGNSPAIGLVIQQGEYAGRWIVPMLAIEAEGLPPHDFDSPGPTYLAYVIYSDDQGVTWQIGGAARSGWKINEWEAVELRDGTLLGIARTYSSRPVKESFLSADGGLSWSYPTPTTLPDERNSSTGIRGGVARADALGSTRLQRLLYVTATDPATRGDIVAYQSFDEGATWQYARLLHDGPGGYACVMMLDRQTVLYFYESGAVGNSSPAYLQRITCARTTLSYINL